MMQKAIFLYFLLVAGIAQAQKNQTDEQGRKQGYWEQTYSNGNIKYKGTFENDEPLGEFWHYDYRLNLVAKVNHLGNDSAKAILYHKGMVVAGEGLYINKEKSGEWTFYDRRGNISAKEHFKAGVRHGASRTYYLNGRVSRKTEFVEGIETGYRIDYNEEGNKIFEGNVVDGVYDGEVTFYHYNGKPKLKGEYRNAVRDGRWIVYDESGIPVKKLDYDLGQLPEGQTPAINNDSESR